MKKTKNFARFLITFILLAGTVVPVFAQSEGEPLDEPVVVEEEGTFWDNPIVQLLSEFFSSLFEPAEEEEGGEGDPPEGDPPTDGTPTDPTEGGEGDGEEEPVVLPAEFVSMLHTEENLGFGEMTKLFAMVLEAQAACEESETFCNVTLEGMLEEYKSGGGFGALFKKYGKPDMVGVGHVRKAAMEAEAEMTEEAAGKQAKPKKNNGKAKGRKK